MCKQNRCHFKREDTSFLLTQSICVFSVLPASSSLERGVLAAAAATSRPEPPPPALAQLRRVGRLGRLILQRRVCAGLGPLGFLRLPTSPSIAGTATAKGLPASDGRPRASSASDPTHEIEVAAAQLCPLCGSTFSKEHHRSVGSSQFLHHFLFIAQS